MSQAGKDVKEVVSRKGSLLQTISAVAWGFFGVRRGKDRESDMAKLNPLHVIIAGLIGAALLVLMLVLLIRWVIGSGVAG
ncbi:MAG: DUF2970 domain-containing protein [Comamonadaceae bacterium]|nr:DUF2970 domain-containing protein [Comamonadaceae bacterium]